MSNKCLYRIFLSVIVAVSFFSCKKNETTTKYYLSGSIDYGDVCPIQSPGGKVDITITGVSHPKGKKLSLGYKFEEQSDTLSQEFTSKGLTISLTMPDEPASYTLTVNIIPEDTDVYYASSGSMTFLVYDSEKSFTGLEYPSNVFTDPRDGKTYPYFDASGVKWMSMNMAYQGTASKTLGTSYYSSLMDRPWGRYYTWEDAKEVCPQGWTLPTDADFVALAKYFMPDGDFYEYRSCEGVGCHFMNKASFTTKRMWPYDPKIPITDKPEFQALPMGYVNTGVKDNDYKYGNFFYKALFWTSEEDVYDNRLAIIRHLDRDSNSLMVSAVDKSSIALSVRCIKK